MLKFLILLTISASAIADPLRNNIPVKNNTRIYGGQKTSIEFVPYQVSLVNNFGQLFCGGAIISNKWVLTAAICGVTDEHTIRAGSTFNNKGGSLHTVINVINHKDFRIIEHGIPLNDIALIKVFEPFHFDKTRQPVQLLNANEQIKPGSVGLVAGWSETENGDYPNYLLSVAVLTIPKSQCDDSYNTIGGLPQGQICAGNPDGQFDACTGDAGSPLVINDRLVGIVSWGYGCGLPNYPGVYTDISAYRFWVYQKLQENSK
ncbi:GSCOCT00001097001.2-RA-CDS [Cotesia congregata]|uniref:trypsin n=1 Tax=Cotesia congregata TaxID=51543 RepID=A0A8J2HHV7_COTCN|nr:GSCOCT00001097001.2-RA-CDS [Cotesia congregata]CAG5096131.1 Trypsin-1-like [Cotesia congregata]